MKQNLYFLPFLILLSGCANLMSNFDQNSYVAALELKTESLSLISKADDKASAHVSEIDYLKAKLNSQVAYQEGKGKPNRISAAQWRLLVSEDKDLLGRFLKDWQSEKPMSKFYRDEKILQIGEAFDEIIKLEAAKDKI